MPIPKDHIQLVSMVSRRPSLQTDRSFRLKVDPEAKLCHVQYEGVIKGDAMVRSVIAMIQQRSGVEAPDVIWDCSQVSVHSVSPDEFAEMGRLVLENVWGHHAIIYSRAHREDIISDLFRRFLEHKGESASTHLSIEGALLQLERGALPRSFTAA